MSTTSNIPSDDDDEQPGEEAPTHDEVTAPVSCEMLHNQPTPNKLRRQPGKCTKTDPVEDTLISTLHKDAEKDEESNDQCIQCKTAQGIWYVTYTLCWV